MCGSALVQLGSCRDPVIYEQEVKHFLAVIVVDCADEHAVGVLSHHLSRWKIYDSDRGLADEFFRSVVLLDAAQDDPVFACSIVQSELQELVTLRYFFAVFDLDCSEIRLAEGVKIDEFFEQRLDLDLAEVDLDLL
jgi:hypothetical protein